MTLLHIDGFDHYSTNGVQTSSVAAGAYSTIAANNNHEILTWPAGGLCDQTFSFPGFGYMLIRDLVSSYSSGSLGVGYHLRYTATSADFYELISFLSSAGTMLYNVTLDQANGKLLIKNAAGTTLATSAGTLVASTIYHVEAKIIIAGSSGGSIDVRVNGSSFVSIGSLTTNGTAINKIGLTKYTSGSALCPVQIDDLFIWDSLGAQNNNWLGEQTVYTLFPSADTGTAAWTKSTGSNGYDLINDVPAVDTRYVEGNTVGDVSIFDLTNLPTTALTVAGVLAVMRGEKTAVGAGTIDFGPVHAGTPSLASRPQTNGQFLYTFGDVSELNPSTGLIWLSTEVNAAQLELSRTA